MKIAITHENGDVFQHFGQTKEFKVYEIEDGSTSDGKILSSGTYSHGGLADLLKQNNVNVLICGGIGEGAKNMLEQCGITLGISRNFWKCRHSYCSDGQGTTYADSKVHMR